MAVQNKRVGLSLGGGVARGWAHIGVLSVLEKAGIGIDFVAGSSAGSLVGAFYCSGMELEQMKSIASRLRWRHIVKPVWPTEGLLSFEKMEKWLVDRLGDIRFEDLKIPFAAVTTDLATGKTVAIKTGRLAPAVHASCSVPGIFTPVHLDGRILADGSLSEDQPVDILHQMGAEYVIAVDIFTPALRRRWGALGLGFSAFEILVENAGGGIAAADCLIAPDLAGNTYLRLSKYRQLFELGEAAALAKLPEIQEALCRQ